MSDNGDNVKHGTDGACFICGERTVSRAANPSKWAVFHPYPGGNGKWRRYCEGCVIGKLNAPVIADLQAQLARANETADAKVAAATCEGCREGWKRTKKANRVGTEKYGEEVWCHQKPLPVTDETPAGYVYVRCHATTDASRALAEHTYSARIDELDILLTAIRQVLTMEGLITYVRKRNDEIYKLRAELSREP